MNDSNYPAIFISLIYLTEVHPLDFVSLNHTVTNLSIWTLSRRHEDRMLNSGSLQSTKRSHSPSLILLEGTTASVSPDHWRLTGAVYCASRPLLPTRGGTYTVLRTRSVSLVTLVDYVELRHRSTVPFTLSFTILYYTILYYIQLRESWSKRKENLTAALRGLYLF